MLKVLNIVGARPNFMKVAPIYAEMKRREGEFTPLIVHTGQHYDEKMSKTFFSDLGMPKPDVYLGVGSDTHAVQTAKIMLEFEPVVLQEKPDWVLVVGDVNSTIACTLVAKKLNIKVAHVEAGLRSRDMTMPEEINRILTDSISDLLLTPSRDADMNLHTEGISKDKISFVGNVMIDSLLKNVETARQSGILNSLGLENTDYGVVTLHRPSNVDKKEDLDGLIGALQKVGERLPIVFPAHPRTHDKLKQFGYLPGMENSGIKLIEPQGYLDFLKLLNGAKIVLTDSGGLQEETTALGIPCLTLRENTERPITVELGTNILVGLNPERIVKTSFAVLDDTESENTRIPEFWDGKTAERICDTILQM